MNFYEMRFIAFFIKQKHVRHVRAHLTHGAGTEPCITVVPRLQKATMAQLAPWWLFAIRFWIINPALASPNGAGA